MAHKFKALGVEFGAWGLALFLRGRAFGFGAWDLVFGVAWGLGFFGSFRYKVSGRFQAFGQTLQGASTSKSNNLAPLQPEILNPNSQKSKLDEK